MPGPDMLPSFVDTEWLREHFDDVVLADVRWYLDDRDGREAYLQGHLPGAVFVDLDHDLAAPPSPMQGRHPLPAPDEFAMTMSRLGIGDDDVVVAYDDAGGAIASRLVWMLRATGHSAAVLSGGLQAWDGPLEQEEPSRATAEFTMEAWSPQRVADLDDVAAASDSGDAVIVDARDPDRYRGEREPIDPRAGHIPGAVNVPFRQLIEGEGPPTPPEDLADQLRREAEEKDVIVYCGSGVTACLDVLTLELAGIPARLYPGSFSQWSSNPERPVATGEGPG